MKPAKAFFLVCAGILMLAVAVNLTTGTAVAADGDGDRTEQIAGIAYSSSGGSVWVVTDTGRLWQYYIGDQVWWEWEAVPFSTVAQSTSLSQLKTNYGK